MTDLYRSLLDDLAAEHADLDAVVAPLTETGWSRPTPAEGWSISDTIRHLALTDEVAALAVSDPAAFDVYRQQRRVMASTPSSAIAGCPRRNSSRSGARTVRGFWTRWQSLMGNGGLPGSARL